MDKARIATITAGIGLLGAILALDWSHLLDALQRVPDVVQRWTGLWGFLLALALGCLAWGWVTKYPTFHACDARQHFCADTVALVVGLTVSLLQIGTSLSGLWTGLLAGLAAPYISRGVWSLFAPPKEPQS